MARTYTQVSLLRQAQDWDKISREGSHCQARIVCLLFAFEFYLKAYLLSINKNLQDEDLREMGHQFLKIFHAIESREKDVIFLQSIRKGIETYDLFNINMIELRYPQKYTAINYDRPISCDGYLVGDLFDEISKRISLLVPLQEE